MLERIRAESYFFLVVSAAVESIAEESVDILVESLDIIAVESVVVVSAFFSEQAAIAIMLLKSTKVNIFFIS